MANLIPQDREPVVKMSSRLWSEEVGSAEADSIIAPRDPGYEFSNGRKFVDGKGAYAPDA